MSAAYFVDTNILLWAVGSNAGDATKTTAARQVLARADIGISVQVLQEFYVQATRVRPQALSHDDAVAFVEVWLTMPLQPNDERTLRDALRIKAECHISFWDAAIIAAARALGCHTLITEDLNDGQDYAGIRVHNPFRRAVA